MENNGQKNIPANIIIIICRHFYKKEKKNFEICMKRKILVPMKKKVLIFLIKTRKNNKEV